MDQHRVPFLRSAVHTDLGWGMRQLMLLYIDLLKDCVSCARTDCVYVRVHGRQRRTRPGRHGVHCVSGARTQRIVLACLCEACEGFCEGPGLGIELALLVAASGTHVLRLGHRRGRGASRVAFLHIHVAQ